LCKDEFTLNKAYEFDLKKIEKIKNKKDKIDKTKDDQQINYYQVELNGVGGVWAIGNIPAQDSEELVEKLKNVDVDEFYGEVEVNDTYYDFDNYEIANNYFKYTVDLNNIDSIIVRKLTEEFGDAIGEAIEINKEDVTFIFEKCLSLENNEYDEYPYIFVNRDVYKNVNVKFNFEVIGEFNSNKLFFLFDTLDECLGYFDEDERPVNGLCYLNIDIDDTGKIENSFKLDDILMFEALDEIETKIPSSLISHTDFIECDEWGTVKNQHLYVIDTKGEDISDYETLVDLRY
jgi:hypothetical protein